MKVIGRLFSYINRVLFSVWLPSSAKIGANFTLAYWGLGTVIHHRCEIGDNVTIGQNVTIGRNFGDVNVPVICNNVYIGAGTVIFGDITIADNVIIGANSVVNKSVGPNTTVAGNPLKTLKSERLETYLDLDKETKSSYWSFWFK